VGDFDRDGKADMFWRNTATGENIVWLMNGATVAFSAFLPTIADTNWDVAGVGEGDMFGNQKAEVIWRNRVTLQNAVWVMNGAMLASASLIGVSGYSDVAGVSGYQVAAVRSVDGDPK